MLNQEAHPAHDCGMANIQRFNTILARVPLPEEPDSTKARANVFRRIFVPEFVKKLRIRYQLCELVGNLVWFSHHPTFSVRLSGHASGRHDSRGILSVNYPLEGRCMPALRFLQYTQPACRGCLAGA